MILQVPQADQKALDQLENLLQMLPSLHKKRPVIERKLRMLLSGRTGEKNVAYQLEFWYKDAADVVVANDLRVEYNGRSVQIDHFVALPAGFLVIESKSLPDHIYIDEAGNWFRMGRGKRGVEDREGMSNPIEQNKRHIAVLQELFGSVAHGGVPPLANVIVFPHPKVVVRGSKPAGAYLLRVDQLHTFIEKLRGSKPGPETASTFDLIKLALTYHRPLVFDPYERYHIDKKDVLPLSRRIEFDVKQKAYLCVFCAAKMALQRDRNGLFWGCPNNPQCKNRVPASVAVQIGTEAVERSEKDKDFLTWLFTDKPRLCPNCGDILQRKKSRNKEY